MATETMTTDDVMRATLDHKLRVADLMLECIRVLNYRAVHHDDSKFSPEEWPHFAEATPQLKGLTYGSNEYRAALAQLKPAIDHHNTWNTHHPEHHPRGIDDMTLLDVLEMLCDWKAATERHADGSLVRSFDVNRERFSISPQLERIMQNTAITFSWMSQRSSTKEGE